MIVSRYVWSSPPTSLMCNHNMAFKNIDFQHLLLGTNSSASLQSLLWHLSQSFSWNINNLQHPAIKQIQFYIIRFTQNSVSLFKSVSVRVVSCQCHLLCLRFIIDTIIVSVSYCRVRPVKLLWKSSSSADLLMERRRGNPGATLSSRSRSMVIYVQQQLDKVLQQLMTAEICQ